MPRYLAVQHSAYAPQTRQPRCLEQQESTRSGGRCDMRPTQIITEQNTDYHKNGAFSLMKCIRVYVSNGPLIIVILV